jgi:hypothetical protein
MLFIATLLAELARNIAYNVAPVKPKTKLAGQSVRNLTPVSQHFPQTAGDIPALILRETIAPE